MGVDDISSAGTSTKYIRTMTGVSSVCFAIVLVACAAQDEKHARENLLPLTQFRREHRRTIDGRLCAAAFVQDRRAHSGCTKTKSPLGDSGREWCYVEAQVASGPTDSANPWNYCGEMRFSHDKRSDCDVFQLLL
eukprot:TRINITY_DN840_c0_g1_i3.p1 TRINITY_DN840_c0_g1~~TRINITY_DN840_c0_g1_i3.p1  ORF type:complete len:145 (+),score=19.67 TRINITY_DN840_c0_g1_i3:32-436(+)